MNVSLTKELEAFIERKVESGLYGSSSEVVREALRLLIERDRLRRLREEVELGLTQLDQGAGIPAEHVIAELKGRSRGGR